MDQMTLALRADTAPIDGFIRLLELAKLPEATFQIGNLPSELVRIENDLGAADTCELTVRLYPSDALLRHVAAVLARDV